MHNLNERRLDALSLSFTFRHVHWSEDVVKADYLHDTTGR